MYLVLPSDAPGWKYSAAKAAGWPSFSTSANTKDGGNVSLSPRCNIWRDRSSKVFCLHAPTAPITTYVLLTRRLLSARPLSWLRDRCLGYVMKKYQRETEKKFLSSVRLRFQKYRCDETGRNPHPLSRSGRIFLEMANRVRANEQHDRWHGDERARMFILQNGECRCDVLTNKRTNLATQSLITFCESLL